MLQFSRGWRDFAAIHRKASEARTTLPGAANHGANHPGPSDKPLLEATPLALVQMTRPLSRGRLLGAVALCLVCVGVGARAWGQAAEPAPAQAAAPAAERTLVALLPIVIHSIEDQTFLRSGLGDMLLSRLAREPQLAVLPVREPDSATTDLETARAAVRGTGAKFVIFGSFTHFGAGASVDLVCAEVAGDAHGPRQVFVHAGSLGEIIPTLDGLADRIARYIVLGPTPRPTLTAERGGGGGSPPDLEDLRRRVEALEQAMDGELAVEEEIEVPGIFQVYPEGESAPN